MIRVFGGACLLLLCFSMNAWAEQPAPAQGNATAQAQAVPAIPTVGPVSNAGRAGSPSPIQLAASAVSVLPGWNATMTPKLAKIGITSIGELAGANVVSVSKALGSIPLGKAVVAQAQDYLKVTPGK